MYTNKYWKRQKVELVKSSKKFVWIVDQISGIKAKIKKQTFEDVFKKEKSDE